jgi:hypothetical protein
MVTWRGIATHQESADIAQVLITNQTLAWNEEAQEITDERTARGAE